MCFSSYVGDYFSREFPVRYPNIWPYVNPIITLPDIPVNPVLPNQPTPGIYGVPYIPYTPPSIPREEFEKLKNEVAELKELLKAAKRYDEKTGQPDCQNEEKVALLKKVAKLVGVDLTDLV